MLDALFVKIFVPTPHYHPFVFVLNIYVHHP
jgi:hypothetical protein